MKRNPKIFAAAVLALCVVLFSASLAFGAPASALPEVVESVVRHREFFARLQGYGHCFLHDAEKLPGGRVGVVLLTPLNFELRIVFDMETGKEIYRSTTLPEKSRREAMRQMSVSVADAVELAKSAVSRAK
jgi:hypothetical protein